MRLTRVTGVLACALAAGLAAGCGSNPPIQGRGGPAVESPADKIRVGLAYDIGGRGDQSFNDAAAAGLDRAERDFGVEGKELEASAGETDAQKEERLRLLADDGYNPIIAVGYAYAAALKKAAAQYPDVDFALVDSSDAKAANITNLVFAEEQGSFLVGAAAGLKSRTQNVGFVGGVQVPLINKFEAGYLAGAKYVKPGIRTQSKYLTQPPDMSGFGDPAKGRTAAQGMIDAGADVVYQAAGGSGAGVFEAVRAANVMAIGVDSDQALTAAPAVRSVIITSMIKRVDVAVYDFIDQAAKGTVKGGEQLFDLKVDGVGYSTTGGHIDDIVPQLEEIKKKIISGQIKVPTTT